MQKKENKRSAEKIIAEYAKKDINKLFSELNSRETGLNQIEADERLGEYGKNIIDIQNSNNLFERLKEAIINPFNIVLIVVAIITYITDVIIAETPSYATVVMLVIIVILSAVISFIQTEKSNSAAKKLQKMITNKIDVIRNDNNIEIDIEDAVPGDIVKLASGDMIPGDVRFFETKDLFIDQSQLTGESNPVEKFSYTKNYKDISEIANIGLMGSNVVSGSAKGIILTTGNQTYFGSMAKSLSTDKTKTSFEQNIDSISKLLIKFMIVMIPIIFVVNLYTKSNWLESLMFGITIAVGLLPEMLPVIMTSSLAKDAVVMSKKKTIVKRLSSIQTFGEMDILCTDKTGTLTEDKIILEKYLNVEGKEDKRILKHAFLNSYFQTGLKNLMDLAIISRAEKEEMAFLEGDYIKEDEIPFDFTRKRMSVVLKDQNGKRQLITKGAVEEILSICSFIELNGKVEKISKELIENARKIYEDNNNDGLRMIAVAQKNEIHGIETFGIQDEKDMVLIGFVGFLDPPKKSAKSAIDKLKKHGVKTVVLTGDSEGVALNVCNKLGINTEYTLTGSKIDEMSDEELKNACEKCYLFSKLTPFQKKRIVKIMQENGHTVGYMGDGINDSPPLKQSDVGISVDTAVDIAKEVADIILLEKDLNVLEEGVVGGRKTFANVIKYIKMAVSGNFGNMISVVIASIALPFLPLLPIHILIQNILNDFAQLGMPFDNVEQEYIERPKKWDVKSIRRFMLSFGLLSTVLDVLCFLVLWYVFKFNTIEQAAYFQCGWFMFGVISQTFVIHTIRTSKIPFIQATASKQLNISTVVIILTTMIIGFTGISEIFDLKPMPYLYLAWIFILIFIYLITAQIMKKFYIKKNDEWI